MKFSILLTIFLVSQVYEISNSIKINCDFHTGRLPVTGIIYECQAVNIPTSSGMAVTNIAGTHESEKNNNDVTSVYISGNKILPFIPRYFSNFFPSVKAILIYNTAIEALFGDEFDEFPQLEYLEFWSSNLKSISSKLFKKKQKMVYIGFNFNMIEKVGYDLFTPLNVTHLQYLYLQNNFCINKSVTDKNTTSIISLINEIREKCPFDDEFPTTTTNKNFFCTDESIEELVCNLKSSMIKVQENLTTQKEEVNEILKKSNITNEILIQTIRNLNNAHGKIETVENDLIQNREIFKNKLNKIQTQIQIKNQKIEEIQSELDASKKELDDIKSKMQWMEEELLRITTQPCVCK
ncbi:hypothetical protein PVAND_016165 [Polypedilum vanderplanki]|uniref:Uncharacterized protein n=1 Tax=Polypedilum vanderplanki TaxID=319348 RepID=A0A9J6BEB1_POLVA|nr:hypothetical protein PVAND_016165 [Polypedilum vanderplanki]